MDNKHESSPAAPQFFQHGNALQEASLALMRIEKAARFALDELEAWHQSYPEDAGTAKAVAALRAALSG